MRRADNLPPSCVVVVKSGNLNCLEPSGPLQACNGVALPLSYILIQMYVHINNIDHIQSAWVLDVISVWKTSRLVLFFRSYKFFLTLLYVVIHTVALHSKYFCARVCKRDMQRKNKRAWKGPIEGRMGLTFGGWGHELEVFPGGWAYDWWKES